MAKSITIPLTAEQYEVIAALAKREGLELTKLVHELVRREAVQAGMAYQMPPPRGWGKGRARNYEKRKAQVLEAIAREMPNCPTGYDEAVRAWRAWSQAVIDSEADVQEAQRVMVAQGKIEGMVRKV